MLPGFPQRMMTFILIFLSQTIALFTIHESFFFFFFKNVLAECVVLYLPLSSRPFGRPLVLGCQTELCFYPGLFGLK